MITINIEISVPHDTQPNDLHICLMNTRSLINKLSNFQSFICSSDFSILCITETWLSQDIFDNEIYPMATPFIVKIEILEVGVP